MTSRTTGVLLRSLRSRLYGTAAAKKEASESRKPLVKQGLKVTKLDNGLTVASVEDYSPISNVAVIIKAGARYETTESLGVTHALRVASTMSTHGTTSINMVRSVQQTGANIGCTATREYMIYSAEGLRDQIPISIEAIRQMTTGAAFKDHEWVDFIQRLRFDVADSSVRPDIKLLEMLHEAAFRKGLGRSLYTTEHLVGNYYPDKLLNYMQKHYTQGRMAIVGTGIDHDQLVSQAKHFLPYEPSGVKSEKSVYHGGEIRCETGGSMAYAAVVTEGPSLSSKDLLAVGVLQMIMGTGPHVKYSNDTAGSKLGHGVAEAVTNPFAISCINANYTDSGLFGFYLLGHSSDMDKGLKAAFATFAKVTKLGVTDSEVTRGKNQLRAAIGMYLEDGNNRVMELGEQIMGGENMVSFDDIVKMIDSIKPADVTSAAKKVINGKPSMAAIGNLGNTPYLDEIMK